MKTPVRPSPRPADRRRLVRAARARLLAAGYRALNLDELAAELGLSKKTLYRHFPGKEALARAALEDFVADVRADADRILADRSLGFAARLAAVAATLHRRLGEIGPHVLRDLQRHAPALHERVFALRRRHLPAIFGRLLAEGQRARQVRADLDPEFATQFLLHAMQGLMHPDTLGALGLTPAEALERALRLHFGGILTPAGRHDHEKQPRR